MRKSSAVFLYLVPLLAVLVTGVPRQLILYESERSNERFHTFTSAIPDARVFPWMRNIQRICYLGSWYCYPEPGYKDPVQPGPVDHYNDRVFRSEWIFREYSDLTFTCKNLSSLRVGISNRLEFRQSGFAGLCGSFRPAGGGLDLSMDTLTLFNEENMRGQEITLSQNRIQRLPKNFTVRSLAWTGKNSSWTPPKLEDDLRSSSYQRGGGSNWTLFEEADYGGLAKCLDPMGEWPFDKPYVQGVSELGLKSIGSIKRGCESADASLWRLDRNGWPKLKAIGSAVIGKLRDVFTLSMYAMARG